MQIYASLRSVVRISRNYNWMLCFFFFFLFFYQPILDQHVKTRGKKEIGKCITVSIQFYDTIIRVYSFASAFLVHIFLLRADSPFS